MHMVCMVREINCRAKEEGHWSVASNMCLKIIRGV